MPIATTTSSGKPSAASADVLILPVIDGKFADSGFTPSVRQRLQRQIRAAGFTARAGNAELLVWRGSGLRTSFIGLVDMGEKRPGVHRMAEALRRGAAKIVQSGRAHGIRSLVFNLHDLQELAKVPPDIHAKLLAAVGAAIVEGVELANYRYVEYSPRMRREQRAKALRAVTLLVDKQQVSAVQAAVRWTQRVLPGVVLARDLVNRPAGDVRPRTLADRANALVDTSPTLGVTVWDHRQAEQNGFTAFLAVARGSVEEPYVIHLTYTPRQPARKKIFIVGKGITFDSGGLNLKPTGYMESMKMDMAGAAVVLGLFSVLPRLALPVEVHGVIATCENMPSGSAYRPGDVLRARNGKTIEVLNTDAEGRITLADALSFAVEHKPDAVIDLATLTGACMVALGETYAGLWSNSDALQETLLMCAQEAGEGLTALPLPDEYDSYLASKVADVRNVRGPAERIGGAIEAALFLREFVGGVPWAHLDIAGPAYMEKEILPYYPVGATGYGMRTLVAFLRWVGAQPALG